MVKITIVGTGYVGLVSGTCLAEVGHEVICTDVSEEKIDMLNSGKLPIYEDGLDELVHRNVREKRLSFTTDVADSIRKSDVIFSAVGTPPGENHEADLKFVREVAKTFANNLNSYKIFVNKSTVPVGTGQIVREIVESITDNKFDVVSNPEFLREGNAIEDFLKPDRIVIGCESERAKEIMTKIYEPFTKQSYPLFSTNVKSAELIKYAANSFLATKISFINEISRYCDIVGADVTHVSKGIGLDSRIGPKFLQAGIGYGGSCFPKDVDALYMSGKNEGYSFKILEKVREVNREQRLLLIEKLKKKIPDVYGKKVTIWGLAFKPGTDDVREAPSKEIIQSLIECGTRVSAYDPVAQSNYQKFYSDLDIDYVEDPYDALKGSDALILLTEWEDLKVLNYSKMKEKMSGNVVVDGRNVYNSSELREQGFKYVGIGRI